MYKPGDYIYLVPSLAFSLNGELAFVSRVTEDRGVRRYDIIYFDGEAWRSGGSITELLIAGPAPFAGRSNYEGFYQAHGLLEPDGSIDLAKTTAYIRSL